MPIDHVLPHDLDDIYGPGAEDAFDVCLKCRSNPPYEYKGRVFHLCGDCICTAFAELFESLDSDAEQRNEAVAVG